MARKTSGQAGRTVGGPGRQGRAAPPPPRRWGRWILAGIAVVALVVVGGVLARRGQAGPALTAADVATFDDLEPAHQEGAITYPQTPPVGGPHSGTWQTCGTYKKPLANENAVHSLEHGAVWITYRPDLPAPSIEQLAGLGRGRSYLLISPYPDLPAPIVASAWGAQLKADSADDPRIAQFVTQYLQGEQAPEPGATCRGGLNLPTGS